jgi:hypothetical protein
VLGDALAGAGLAIGGEVGTTLFSTGLSAYELSGSVGAAIYGLERAGADEFGTLKPGRYADKSIPARGPARDFTNAERDQIDAIGKETGCHTCGTTNPGTKSGHFIPDHQPPNVLNPDGGPQRLYPQCLACSRQQGGEVLTYMRTHDLE